MIISNNWLVIDIEEFLLINIKYLKGTIRK